MVINKDNQVPPPPNPDDNKAIMEFGIPDLNKLNSAITPPTVNARHFKIKGFMIQMINAAGQFGGLPSEDPHLHLKTFMEMCDSFVISGIPPDVIRIKLFPFSLRDKARTWLNNLPANSITTWNDLGRPSVVTGCSLNYVEKGEPTMRVNDDQVAFSILKTAKFEDPTEKYLPSEDGNKRH
ncbi:hypothetical protein QN277_019157 [Acacia crassicarpa]|uniref:Retrotransposon gag domain-containing protein n=1 Tax=Acacia crassicarpa TaxID=499986 RepID=A0AAE1JXE9_9FABA|nr:hypothetical protein QN277_019157 [Acacia crassicarpa]